MKPIPDRWLNYSPIGERIPGTRFIAFKVPLLKHVNAGVAEKHRLAPESLLESVPNLGLIIDLTNTNRYYQPGAFTANNVRHQKLMIPGKETPPKGLAEKFCRFVADFLEDNADNDKLIGVHCTHGVNRTGYLICYFMITNMNKSPSEAMETFAAARGHEIERQNYTSSLRKLSGKETKKQSSSSKESSVEMAFRSLAVDPKPENLQNDTISGGSFHNGPYQNSYRDRRSSHPDAREDHSERYHPRDQYYNNHNHSYNRYDTNARGHSGDWRHSTRHYSRGDDCHNDGWAPHTNWRQDRSDHHMSYRPAGSYRPPTRGNGRGGGYYQSYQRVDSRRQRYYDNDRD